MKSFSQRSTEIDGLYVLNYPTHEDSRGRFARLFDGDTFGSLMKGRPLAQINHSLTSLTGTVRGLHCQVPPYAEVKVVLCLAGSVFDVVVDVRRSSTTFGRSWGINLNAQEHTCVVIPHGCLHGFQTLTPNVEMLYLHSAPYRQASEAGLNPLDPEVGIKWPLAISEMSGRDREERRTLESFLAIRW